MVSVLCNYDYSTRAGSKFYEGRVYEVGEVYFQYQTVFNCGVRCYIEKDVFKRVFSSEDSVLSEVNKMFNSIMDDKAEEVCMYM